MPDGFHASFRAALAGDAGALAPWAQGPAAEAALSVHRNTIAKGRADALVAQFPTVAQVVGAEWLGAAATVYAADHPPRRASLLDYGRTFPDWLAGFPPAADMPYLAGLARLDWLSARSANARDAEVLSAAALAGLSAEDVVRHTLDLHPAAAFAGFDDSTPSLWRALQAPYADALELGDAPEGLLFVRPGLVQQSLVLSPGDLAFLLAIELRASLADAGQAALAAEPGLDLAAAFARFVATGAFVALRTLP